MFATDLTVNGVLPTWWKNVRKKGFRRPQRAGCMESVSQACNQMVGIGSPPLSGFPLHFTQYSCTSTLDAAMCKDLLEIEPEHGPKTSKSRQRLQSYQASDIQRMRSCKLDALVSHAQVYTYMQYVCTGIYIHMYTYRHVYMRTYCPGQPRQRVQVQVHDLQFGQQTLGLQEQGSSGPCYCGTDPISNFPHILRIVIQANR